MLVGLRQIGEVLPRWRAVVVKTIGALPNLPRPAPSHPPQEDDQPPDDEPVAHVCEPTPPTIEVLAARCDGVTFKEIRGEQQDDLIRRYQAGDRHAGEILLRAHAPLITRWVRWYGRGKHDLEFADLMAEAQIGFLHGVARFDFTKAVQLPTYVTHWMRSRVERAKANLGSTIRVPVHLRDQRKKDRADDDPRAVAARNALNLRRLDAPIGDEDGATTLADVVPDEDDPEANVAEREDEHVRTSLAHAILAALPEREADIIKRRAAGETLDDIGATWGVSRERIRQIEASAMVAARSVAEKLAADPAATVPTTIRPARYEEGQRLRAEQGSPFPVNRRR